VARDVIGSKTFNLALVGPFDDPDRFERMIAA
jgi:hypothetical protein